MNERQAFLRAYAKVQGGALDPSSAAAAMPSILRDLGIAVVGINRRAEATRIINAAIAAFAANAAAGSTVNSTITFKQNYHIVGVAVAEAAGQANLGALNLTILDENQTTIFLDNQGNTSSLNFWTIAGFPDQLGRPQAMTPLDRYVETNKSWNLSVSIPAAAPNTGYTPYVYLYVEPWNPALEPVAPQTGAGA